MILETLLDGLSTRDFLDDYFFKLPYAGLGSAGPFAQLGNWSALERLLATESLDLFVGNAADGVYQGPRPTTNAAARSLLERGFTIAFRHVQDYDEAFSALAHEFASQLGGTVDIHLHCTPAGQRGFGWHYDAEEVFILQSVGSKEWSLRKNTVNPWPVSETLPVDMAYRRESMPLVGCLLKENDWLYLPAGYWHSTEAKDESISISIGLTTSTGIDVYDLLRVRLLDELRWRQRLPVLGTAAALSQSELVATYSACFRELADDFARQLADPRLIVDLVRCLASPGTKR